MGVLMPLWLFVTIIVILMVLFILVGITIYRLAREKEKSFKLSYKYALLLMDLAEVQKQAKAAKNE